MLGGGNVANGIQRHAADFSFGLVDDTRKAQIVVGIVNQCKIRQNILDLFSVVETRATEHTVRNTAAREHLFNAVRLRVHAVQNRKVTERAFIRAHKLHDLFGDIHALIALCFHFGKPDLVAALFGSP